MTSQAGAASAPVPPRQKAVASSTAGVAQCIATTAVKTIDTAVTASCAPISSRRASKMSVSTPAGRVKRNIGSVVAIWTAETIIGSGLRLVISQFDEVSNNANPMFEAEFAIRMTVNARLPKTPHRQAVPVGASGLTLETRWTRKLHRKRGNWKAPYLIRGAEMANKIGSFKRGPPFPGSPRRKPPPDPRRRQNADFNRSAFCLWRLSPRRHPRAGPWQATVVRLMAKSVGDPFQCFLRS